MKNGYADHRREVELSLGAMREERSMYEATYRDLSDFFLPNRYLKETQTRRTLQKPKGVRSTPLFCRRTLEAGLHAGVTSPSRPWFRLGLKDADLAEWGPVRVWLDLFEERLRWAFYKSNLYEILPYLYGELGTYGVMAGMCFEDDRNPAVPFRFEAYTAGRYYLRANYAGEYDTLYRIRQFTVRQLVQRFGMSNLTPRLQELAKQPGKQELKQDILCTVEPAKDGKGWDSCYWDQAAGKDQFRPLAHRNFAENPLLAAVWDRNEGENYATSCPGMDTLGLVMGLRREEINKAKAIELHHMPPMGAPSELQNSGVDMTPGALTYMPMTALTNGGVRPLYDFKPDYRGLMDNIQTLEGDIRSIWFTDLFLMLSMDERAQRATAEEIRARYDEKVLALGPTLERLNFMLRQLLDRASGIMIRKSMPIWSGVMDGEPLLPPPPKELEDVDLDIEFISSLQQAMKAPTLQAIERFAMFSGQVAQLTGAAPDKFDGEQALDEYGAILQVPARMIRDDDAVAARQEAARQQQQMAQMAAMAKPMADGASAIKTLADTGQGDNNILAALGSIV